MKDDKPYTLDDLATAMSNYRYARDAYNSAVRTVESKRKEMESFERDADREQQVVDRFRAEVRKILTNLEKL